MDSTHPASRVSMEVNVHEPEDWNDNTLFIKAGFSVQKHVTHKPRTTCVETGVHHVNELVLKIVNGTDFNFYLVNKRRFG